jgi:hypothetical protein
MEHYHKRSNIETAYSMIKGSSEVPYEARAIRDRSTKSCAKCHATTSAF